MKVDIMTMCDSAQEYNGKLVIVGTFNSLFAKEFPVTHSELAFVARVIFGENEKGIHNMEVSIKKNDEDVYIMPVTKMSADTSSTDGDAIIHIILRGNNTVIPAAGIYKVLLKVDDDVFESDLRAVLKK